MEQYDKLQQIEKPKETNYSQQTSLIASLCKGRVADLDCGNGLLSDFYFGEYNGFSSDKLSLEKARELRRSNAKFFDFDWSTLLKFKISDYDTIVFSGSTVEGIEAFFLFPDFFRLLPVGFRLVFSLPSESDLRINAADRDFTFPNLRKSFSDFGHVIFHDHENIDKNIIMTVDIGIKPINDISLCIVVKNEALGLKHAIMSCIGFVDNIVVYVDRSSTDHSAALAELYADETAFFDWSDDFSAARNLAHQNIKTKWILFLDGHEFVKSAPDLEKYLKVESAGLLCTVEMDDNSSFRSPRLYKNGNHFEGAIHEKLKLDSVFAYPQFIVKHDRLGAQSQEGIDARYRQTDDMVPRILGKAYQDDKNNIRALFHLCSYYQSRSNYDLALKYQKLYLAKSDYPQERWFVMFNRSLCFLNQNKLFRALWSAQDCDKEMPSRWETQKLFGLIYFKMKRYNQALDCFVNALDPNRFDTVYKPWAREDSSTFNIIGECLYQLRDYYKAAEAFQRASDLAQIDEFKVIFKKRSELMYKIFESQQ